MDQVFARYTAGQIGIWHWQPKKFGWTHAAKSTLAEANPGQSRGSETNMAGQSQSHTRVTLLGRLRQDPGDQAAWAEFVDHYGPKVYVWCRAWSLQEADSQDVTQMVLLKLVATMRDFRYDPTRSFRAWLRTVAQRAWYDFLAARGRPGRGSGDTGMLDNLASVEARDDLLHQLDEEFDREVFEAAVDRVRLRVAPNTWEAFRLTAQEGLPGAEAAARIGMQVAQVYVARRRVQAMLTNEIRQLESGKDAAEPEESAAQ
jgi:RNA polymerase sigma factor (sigma-70 family)